MERIRLAHTYEDMVSLENLLEAWREFVRGKRSRKDVQEFEIRLMDNLLALHGDLSTKRYRHSSYEAFNISDPKPRNIHKASVRDRLVHRALYRMLYPFFDRRFIADSYSCREDKGVHRALRRFRALAYVVSQNGTKTCRVLKCDIRKFFASINHGILLEVLRKHILDQSILWLLSEIVGSFRSTRQGVGLPLGNLTSQLLVNVYMNELDQFVKHRLKAKYYIRYADDFVVLSQDNEWLEDTLLQMRGFLLWELKLSMHPDKVFIKTLASGVDFLGWTHFPDHRVLRTATRRRMLKRLSGGGVKLETVWSYLGLLKHGNTIKLVEKVEMIIVERPA
jgi:RNA-directed DNA polymerase